VTWDPFGTLAQTLWIGGGQWAGKSTVANILARRYAITAYHQDYHNARGHWDRAYAAAARENVVLQPPTPESMYIERSPAESAADALKTLHQAFVFVLDDLRALVSGRPIVAEGWALRPELVAPLVADLRQIIVMVPSAEFRRWQSVHLDRASRPSAAVSDVDLAQRNRMERDRIVAEDAVAQARELGVRVLEVDGTVDAEGIADIVAGHLRLP
jgi:2-phosphoglycerate kinase